MKRIYSYDVWDTLIKRHCPPEMTLKTSLYFFCLYFDFHNHDYIYNEIRKKEKKHYQEKKEYSIFKLILDVIKEKHSDIEKNKLLEEKWNEIYVNIEKNATYPNKEILDLVHKDEGYKIYISDFYLKKDLLDKILKHHNINMNKGFVSIDYNKSKYTGELYDIVYSNLAYEFDSWIHTGDNINSDIKMAQIKKISTRFVKTKQKHTISIKNKLSDEKKIAIILLSFCKKILEKSVELKCSEICFFTREGIFFKKIFDIYLKSLSSITEFNLKTKITPVSRIATLNLRLNENNDLLGFEDALTQYGYDIDTFLSFFDACDSFEGLSEKYATLQKLLNDKKSQEYSSLISFIKNKKKNTLGYLNHIGFTNNEPKLIVDIGWRGSIQDNLSSIKDSNIIGGCYLGLSKCYNTQNSNNKFGTIFDQNITYNKWADKGINLWETIFNGKGGSVIGYKDTLITTKINAPEEKFLDIVINFQEKIKNEFVKILDDTLKLKLPIDDIDSLAINYYKEIITKPSSELASLYLVSIHNDTYGENSFKKKIVKISFSELIKSFFNKKTKRKISAIIKNNGWRESILYSSKTTLSSKLSALLIK
ncbi:hypothetical protein [Xenorhabdus sp. PB62.4]|uniref:hypothetical protein n=1 Tax=Xenorhabdus sp. PB62.4 TaxID=1851573 RepID=UPI0016570E90|nr:hypothetical protein [Xenorhabdus sp. PB62.4]MBC8954434.1 sugar transferase [Xenorhabdus sp. PB62.4]